MGKKILIRDAGAAKSPAIAKGEFTILEDPVVML